jgi:uncharacterized protein RhaS with RHS repeats
MTDPLGRETTRFVDAAGRVRQVRDPLGRATRYAYDALKDGGHRSAGQTSFTCDENRNRQRTRATT